MEKVKVMKMLIFIQVQVLMQRTNYLQETSPNRWQTFRISQVSRRMTRGQRHNQGTKMFRSTKQIMMQVPKGTAQ